MAPLKSFPTRKHKSPWLTGDIKNLIKHRDWLARKFKLAKDSADLEEKLAIAKRRVKSHIRSRVRAQGEEALTTQDHRGAWSFIKAATFTNKKNQDYHQDLIGLNNYFADVVTTNNAQPLEAIQNCDENEAFRFKSLTVSDTECLLKSIKPNTATGSDELPGFLLKQLAVYIAPNLTTILNKSLSEGAFPTLWKQANVCAVWKGKGSKNEPSNYRPISIIPVVARVFEKVVASELYRFCDSREIIPSEQFGFRRKSSCEMALLHALDRWICDMDAGLFVGALAIDLSKAFDTVPHQQLLQELSQIGCSSGVLTWFQSYLSNRLQRVTQRPEVTQWKVITRGVPQASCLSPLLFNVFVRYLPNASSSEECSCTTQFADDVTNSVSDSDIDVVVTKLTANFDATKKFCDSKGLIINPSKTQMVIFKPARKKLQENLDITLDGCVIKPIDSMKILGVTLDQHLTLKTHIDNVVRKCHGLIGALSRAVPFLPRSLLKLAYTSLIRSHLEYSSALLAMASKTHLSKLDTIQRIAARVIYKAPRDAHSEPILEALGIESLEKRRSDHIIDLVEAIIEKNCHPAFFNFFHPPQDGILPITVNPRLKIGGKRFSVMGAQLYNDRVSRTEQLLTPP